MEVTVKIKSQRNKKGIDRIRAIWHNIKYRCYNPNAKAYKHYGGRGIHMSDEWKNNFETFYTWSINNGYDDNMSIDRIDNDGNYCAENCQWITKSENTSKSDKITRRRYPDSKMNYMGISPSGETFVFDNAAAFEKEHKITRGAVGRCARNERSGWRGWKFKYI